MDKLQELIDRIEAREFHDVDEVLEAAIALSGKWEAKECSLKSNVHDTCTDGKSEQTKEKPTAPDSLVEEFKKFAKDNELKSDLNGYAAGVIKEIIRKLEAQ